jgi:hypothetical protein
MTIPNMLTQSKAWRQARHRMVKQWVNNILDLQLYIFIYIKLFLYIRISLYKYIVSLFYIYIDKSNLNDQ